MEGVKTSGKEKVMELLRCNSSEILLSSSVESCSPPPLFIITDDEGEEDSTSESDVISINSSDEMEAMVSGLDRISDRSVAMIIKNNFYKALQVASVQYACDEVTRIMNLTDDKECYIPSSDLVLHILRWLAIEVNAKCGNMQWRYDVKYLVRKSLTEIYANTQGDTVEYAERCANMYGNAD